MNTLRGLLIILVLALCATGCRPSEPSPADWRQKAGQSLEDVASELATAQLTLEAQGDAKLLAKTGVVLLVDAEESAGTTVESFTALQPPKGFERRHTEVSDVLEHASGLLADVRAARVREDEASYGALSRRLARERSTLTKLEEEVR
ncbi:MAG TPA: hypothetical protein VIR30_13120 [Nocardioides sp.]|uniref:DUF4349 domain-containing protein n=1 Tax=Nocardioides daedukensis TaxID=634462 RepID=A0A7Y9RV76_9ACTN|nr:hypothetical protein [Nocardioides daedukensis]NYG57232.1 hypothetical protein [Nocardioides daedukensis]